MGVKAAEEELMGSTEKCPKCGGRLIVEHGGYIRANVSAGFGMPLAPSSSCIMCGYFKEDLSQFNHHAKVKIKKVNNYPHDRKVNGNSGWLQAIVKKEFKRITSMRLRQFTWEDITAKLEKEYPDVRKAGRASMSNVWRRLCREKGIAV